MTLTEKRLVKLQVLLTDSELSLIDDWRFNNRAENRSAAVRELIALGLKFGELRPDELQDFLAAIRKP